MCTFDFPRPKTCPLQLLEEFTTRAGNIDSAGHAALAIFHALHDAGLLAAFGTCGRFRGIHDLFPVGCLCNFRHSISPDRNVPSTRRPAVLPGSWGVTSLGKTRTPADLRSARQHQPNAVNPRGSSALYSPPKSYTNYRCDWNRTVFVFFGSWCSLNLEAWQSGPACGETLSVSGADSAHNCLYGALVPETNGAACAAPEAKQFRRSTSVIFPCPTEESTVGCSERCR